jgi:hypothetical protein
LNNRQQGASGAGATVIQMSDPTTDNRSPCAPCNRWGFVDGIDYRVYRPVEEIDCEVFASPTRELNGPPRARKNMR